MESQWIAVLISLVVVGISTATHILIVGKFIGRSTGSMENMASILNKVEERVEALEGRTEKTDRDFDLIEGRVINIEKAMEKMWELRDSFIRLGVTVEMSTKANQDAMDRLGRGQSVIERQLANIAKDGLGFKPTGPGEG